AEHANPNRLAQPLYWVSEQDVVDAIGNLTEHEWFLGFTNVTSPTNERTFLPTIIPIAGVGNSMPLALMREAGSSSALLAANLSSFIFDYVTRQKIGGVNLNFFIVQQLACLPPSTTSHPAPWSSKKFVGQWIAPRVLELAFTAYDLASFARALGYQGAPFRWDEERRFLLRCELDAAFLHLYGLNRDDAAYVMDTFPIVKRKDEEQFGKYRTKDMILEIYDDMARAAATGRPYQTRLDPPPGDPRAAHRVAEN